MGTWGLAIFSDDVACDVKDSFRDLVGFGLSPEEATERLLQFMPYSFTEAPDYEMAWIALALTQWKLGRLIPLVLDEALKAIDAGGDLDRWEPRDRPKRRAVLQKARSQLLKPHGPPTKVRRPELDASPYQPGDLVSYSHGSGRQVALWVFKNHVSKHPIGSEVVTSDWQVASLGDPLLPSLEAIQAARPALFWQICPTGKCKETLQYMMQYAKDTVGGAWNRLGTVPWSPADFVPFGGRYSCVVQTRKSRSKVLASWHIDRLVEEWYQIRVV